MLVAVVVVVAVKVHNRPAPLGVHTAYLSSDIYILTLERTPLPLDLPLRGQIPHPNDGLIVLRSLEYPNNGLDSYYIGLS